MTILLVSVNGNINCEKLISIFEKDENVKSQIARGEGVGWLIFWGGVAYILILKSKYLGTEMNILYRKTLKTGTPITIIITDINYHKKGHIGP